MAARSSADASAAAVCSEHLCFLLDLSSNVPINVINMGIRCPRQGQRWKKVEWRANLPPFHHQLAYWT